MIKNLIFTALAAAALTVTGCCKEDAAGGKHYLRFSNATVHLANKQGAVNTIKVESDLNWKLAFETPIPGWTTIDKTAGSDNQAIVITSTQDNNTGGYKFATLIATPVSDKDVLPARITVVQYDSTYKKR